MLKNKLFLLCFIISSVCSAQLDGEKQEDVMNEDNLFLTGEVTEYFEGELLPGTSIKAISDGKVIAQGTSDADGRFEIVLHFDKQYEITFSRGGFVSKKMTIDTRGVPDHKHFKCPDMDIDITLFKPMKCVDMGIMSKPVAKFIYFPKKNVIDPDMDYSGPILASINDMLNDCVDQLEEEEIAKEEEAQRKEEEAAAQAQAEKEAKIAEQKRLVEEKAKEEAKRKEAAAKAQAEKEAELAEQKRLAEEKADEEAKRKVDEAKSEAEKEAALAEQKKVAEERAKRKEEEAALAEQKRLAEEKADEEAKRKAAATKAQAEKEAEIAEQRRIAEEKKAEEESDKEDKIKAAPKVVETTKPKRIVNSPSEPISKRKPIPTNNQSYLRENENAPRTMRDSRLVLKTVIGYTQAWDPIKKKWTKEPIFQDVEYSPH